MNHHDHNMHNPDVRMSMDNSTMSSGMSGMSHDMMKMYFHASEHATILFKEWHTMTWAEMLGSCIAVAVLALLYEGLKVGRQVLDKKYKRVDTLAEGACTCGAETGSKTTNSSSAAVVMEIQKSHSKKRKPRILSGIHLMQSLFHFVQLWIGLVLMLIFMTFNIYLCLAVTVGGAIGYFCFAWIATPAGKQYNDELCH